MRQIIHDLTQIHRLVPIFNQNHISNPWRYYLELMSYHNWHPLFVRIDR